MENATQLSHYVGEPSEFLKEERVLLRKRTHVFILIQAIFDSTVFYLATILLSGLFFARFLPDPTLLFIIILISIMIYANAVIKFIMDWYCHFYILTNKRMVQITYKPLFSKYINNVIMHQVKSTEIDVEMDGILNQLLNMGNVIITFDRPTHTEEFRLEHIHDPRPCCLLLAEVLDVTKKEQTEPLWFRRRDKGGKFRIIEEIFPGETAEAV